MQNWKNLSTNYHIAISLHAISPLKYLILLQKASYHVYWCVNDCTVSLHSVLSVLKPSARPSHKMQHLPLLITRYIVCPCSIQLWRFILNWVKKNCTMKWWKQISLFIRTLNLNGTPYKHKVPPPKKTERRGLIAGANRFWVSSLRPEAEMVTKTSTRSFSLLKL